MSFESKLLEKIQNGYQRTAWGSFINKVVLTVQILKFSSSIFDEDPEWIPENCLG